MGHILHMPTHPAETSHRIIFHSVGSHLNASRTGTEMDLQFKCQGFDSVFTALELLELSLDNRIENRKDGEELLN